jgi:hypothetical protein
MFLIQLSYLPRNPLAMEKSATSLCATLDDNSLARMSTIFQNAFSFLGMPSLYAKLTSHKESVERAPSIHK